MNRLLLTALALFISATTFSQVFLMTDTSLSTCTGNLYDDGGPSGNYGANLDQSFTVCPSIPGQSASIQILSLDIDPGGDSLCIYDGNSTAAPLIACFDNSNYLPGYVFQASTNNPTGCITIRFKSNSTIALDGFEIRFSCGDPCQTFYAFIDSTHPPVLPPDTGFIDVQLGQPVQLWAGANFPFNGNVYNQSLNSSTFAWDFGDGTQDTGLYVSHVYNSPGGYFISLTVTDTLGCYGQQLAGTGGLLLKVRVIPPPNFTVDLTDSLLCIGDSAWAWASVEEQTGFFQPPLISGDSIFLPDGSGVSYTTAINVGGFSPTQTLTTSNDLQAICVNMEHSYLGDLQIEITCPNGSNVILKQYPGGTFTHLGEPVDMGPQATGFPGVGYDYCWTDNMPTYNTMVNEAGVYTHTYTDVLGNVYNNQPYLPAGDYTPFQPISGLVGCPLNGPWTMTITDNLSIDDGFIFNWGLQFDPSLYPSGDSFEVTYPVRRWIQDTTQFYNVGDTMGANPSIPGTYNYTYEVTDNYGYTYDTTVRVRVLDVGVDPAFDDTTICSGDTIALFAGPAGPDQPTGSLPCGTGTTCTGNFLLGNLGTASTTTTTTTPYNAFYEDRRMQILYLASELQAAGLSSGTITDLAFTVSAKNSTQDYNNFILRMGCTSATTLSSWQTGLIDVYGPVTYTSTLGTNTHTLSTPFQWDGTSNIVLEVCFDNNSWTQDDEVEFTNAFAGAVRYQEQDGRSACNLSSATNLSAQRPNTLFILCEAPPAVPSFTWAPNVDIIDPNADTAIVFPQSSTDYTVTATYSNGCTATDTVSVTVGGFNYSVSPDTLICESDTIMLSATGGQNYQWSPSTGLSNPTSPTPMVNIDSSITYQIEIQDSTGCSVFEQVTVSVDTIVDFSIGNDTTVCPGSDVSFAAPGGFMSYTWSNGDTASSVEVNAVNSYFVEIMGAACVSPSDTVDLNNYTVVPPSVGPDISLCPGGDTTLFADPALSNVVWIDSINANAVTVDEPGTYFYSAVDNNGCDVQSDTLTFSYRSLPPVNLGPDDSLCPGETKLLVAGTNVDYSYLWSDNSSDSSLLVGQPGVYSVTVSFMGCDSSDAIEIFAQNSRVYPLGPDTTICCEIANAYILSPGGPATGYLWNTGATTSTLLVQQNGTYSVTVTDPDGCTFVDSVDIEFPCLNPRASATDTVIITGQSTDLDVMVGYMNGVEYSWSPVTFLSSPNSQSTTATPDVSGYYVIEVMDSVNGCMDLDSIYIEVLETGEYNMPNAFTPNADGLNDDFYPLLDGIAEVKEFRIYNRWGEIMHDDPVNPWDGTKSGKQMPSDTYVFYVVIEIPLEEDPTQLRENYIQGTVELIR